MFDLDTLGAWDTALATLEADDKNASPASSRQTYSLAPQPQPVARCPFHAQAEPV